MVVNVGLLILLLVSGFSGAFCQTFTLQDDYSYYYYRGRLHPPPPPQSPDVPVATGLSTGTAVGIAVSATFVGTVVLFGLLVFLFIRFRRVKVWGGKTNEVLPVTDGFLRVNANLKGVIVDEDGLDVLYLKKMEADSVSFKKQIYGSSKEEKMEEKDEDEETLRAVNGKERKKSQPVQEIPLLQGKSSASHSLIWSENNNIPPPSVTTAPPRNSGVSHRTLKTADSDHSSELVKFQKGSLKFEGDIMEALFGTVAKNKKSPRAEKTIPASQIFIFDSLKSQSTTHLLNSLGVTRKQITDALTQGEGLNADTILKLVQIAPNEEEASQILAFHGDTIRLAEAESFFYHLLKTVPSAFNRLNAMLLRNTLDFKILQVKESLQFIESACKELRASGVFLKLVEAVLKSGDRMRSGASAGHKQAFNITALMKLCDVKSYDGSTTLLHFAVQEIVRSEGKRCSLNRSRSLNRNGSISDSAVSNGDTEREYIILGLPIVGGLSAEFSNVKKAATLNRETLFQAISTLTSQIFDLQHMMVQCGAAGGFPQKMKSFIETAEVDIKQIQQEQIRVVEFVKETADFYFAGTLRETNPLQLFVISRDFLTQVDKVCVEITKNVQKKKSGSDAEPSAAPRVFKFPKLPANFMPDDSQRNPSDKEDSLVR